MTFDPLDVATLENIVHDFASHCAYARLTRLDNRLLFEKPLASTQSADHPVFANLTQMIPGHLAPREIFSRMFGEPQPAELSVLSLVFPINPATVRDNAQATSYPASSWLQTRIDADALFAAVGNFLIEQFRRHNRRSVYVYDSPLYTVHTEDGFPVFANWSERHVAYACGLGSFGLTRLLITAKGTAHRLMSLVVEGGFDRYGVPTENPFEHCLYLTDGSCGACIKRCPVNAVADGSHSLLTCREFAYAQVRQRNPTILSRAVGGCALCVSGVPCTFRIPGRPRKH